jgi:predicted acylesterase/phospholipase RssA
MDRREGQDPPEARRHGPPAECDLIMKGGITSGVVYPPAVLELSEKYRFRSIGGASAGAIAAAAAAAAEFGRQEGKEASGAGFKRLKVMQEELGRKDFLLGLFQPSDEARPLFDFALALRKRLNEKPPQGERKGFSVYTLLTRIHQADVFIEKQMASAHREGAVVGALILTLLLGPWLWLAGCWVVLPGALPKLAAALILVVFGLLGWLGAFSGSLVRSLIELWRCSKPIRDGERGTFGLCDGSRGDSQKSSRAESGQPPPLTDWLAVALNELAGKDANSAPLTMGELKKHGIQLEVVTSNLSNALPCVLPLKRDTRSWYFRRSDMEKLFSRTVVDYLVEYGERNVPSRVVLPEGFYRFPAGDEMPVLVATRMSLSFPVLLSAVRLYSIRQEGYASGKKNAKVPLAVGDMLPMVFSDGGIASNFPIHLFDSWVPDRPSFGITLYDTSIAGSSKFPEVTRRRSVLLPIPRNADGVRAQWRPINSLGELLIGALDTMQGYRDNLLSAMPGFRERIAQVFLKEGEGGLNLDMDSKVIDELGQRGRDAAQLLIEHFNVGQGMSFSQHLWVRLLVLMAQLEKELFNIRDMRRSAGASWRKQLTEEFQGLMIEQLNARLDPKTSWYRPQDKRWCDEAVKRLNSLLELVEKWDQQQEAWKGRNNGAEYFFAEDPPFPEGLLRVRPEL